MSDPDRPHARAFDLPGWPCPPRVRDIPSHRDSWGHVHITNTNQSVVIQDELGYLWVDGDTIPRFGRTVDSAENPGAIVCWTERGIGCWIHPKSYRYLGNMSRLDMSGDRWIPVAVALSELPAFVMSSAAA